MEEYDLIKSFDLFEDLPTEIRRDILLRDSINRSRLTNKIYKDLLIEDFISNPKLPSVDEVLEFADLTHLSFVMVAPTPMYLEDKSMYVNITVHDRRDLWVDLKYVRINDTTISESSIPSSVPSYLKDLLDNILTQLNDVDDISNLIIYDLRLWYYVLKSRSIKLDLDISDNKIKKILLNNILLRDRDFLISNNDIVLFYYLYMSLETLGYSIKSYFSALTIEYINKNDEQFDDYKIIDISNGLLEMMMNKYKSAINKLEYEL